MTPRKVLIVNKQFQYSYIFKNLMMLLVAFAMIFGAIKVWEKYTVKQGFFLHPPANAEVVAWAKANNVDINSAEFMRHFIEAAKVYTFFDILWKPLAGVLVLNVIILIIANIYYSHRIAGPIHRIKLTLEQKMRGEHYGPISFRKKDEFQEVAEMLNRYFEHQEKKEKPS